ncbi:serine/threonine-protein kinase [Planotetraspora sp. GP83]|uniref:serine/threonine-protein kinase n=1 Tax=Planotetraspora sp. GP83 TaxID=3156264 RepID=UPI0035152C0F
MPRPRPLGPGEPGQIGDYRLVAVLGSGGQGVVYLGQAPSGADVAVKVLHPWMTEDADARRRFLREVDIARRVAPFCTARVLDMGLHDDRPYIVSEYVPGASLERVVREGGPRSGGGLERLAVATASALAAIHRAGIVHRDFKPGNVILGPEGPVVIDFGISRAGDHTVTRSGSVGTPGYMAPEQFTGDTAGPAADVFSWAATMVYAATGHPAFPGDTVPVVLNAILNRDADLSGVPEALRPLLARCLAKDPESRPIAADLYRTLTGEGGPAITLVSPSPTPPPGTAHRAVSSETRTPATTPTSPVTALPLEPATSATRSRPGRVIPPRALLAAGAALVAVAAVLIVPSLLRGPDDHTTTRQSQGSQGSQRGRTTTSTGTGTGTVAATPRVAPFGAPVHEPLTGHANDVRSVALGTLGGTPIALTGSDDDTARTWDLSAGKELGAPFEGHTKWVRSVALGRLNGTPIAVTASDDTTLRVWDLATRAPLGTPLTGHTDAVKAVALGELDGKPVAVSGGADATVRVWDLSTRRQLGAPLIGHRGTVWAVALGRLNGTPIAVTTGDDGTVRVWDLAARKPLGPPLTGHTGWVRAVAVGEFGGTTYAVTGGEDRTVRVWDLGKGEQAGGPLSGHTGPIWAVALGALNGTPIAVTGGEDKTVRVWDLTAAKPLGSPLRGHTDIVWSVAVGELNGGPVAVSGSRDNSVRIWSIASP